MKLKIILFVSLFCLLTGQASAVTITPTGDTHVVIAPGTTYNFGFTTDEPTLISYFYLDGEEYLTLAKSKDFIFLESGSYHNISVFAEKIDITRSNMITYNVIVQRELATTAVDTFNESTYNSVMEHVEDEDYEGLMEDSTKPYTYIFGRLFYLILFVLPYGLMWMKQQSLTIPVVLSLFLGSLFIGFVPEQYKNVILIAIALSYGYNLYMITRER